jgi:hypothetical protein
MKTDQYQNVVPDDLVLLDSSWIDGMPLGANQLNAIDALDWYKPDDGHNGTIGIFVSATELDKALGEETDLEYVKPPALYLEASNWLKIDSTLHRWNLVDGFYHA